MGHFIVSRGVKAGGEAFDNIQPGTYYPAILSYMGGTARANFGPHFVHPPKGLLARLKLRPMSEMCPGPMNPAKVLEVFKKEKLLGKKLDEAIANAIHDAVLTKATMRHNTFQKHMSNHVEFVRAGRNERGLGTADLPELIVDKGDGSSSGDNGNNNVEDMQS